MSLDERFDAVERALTDDECGPATPTAAATVAAQLEVQLDHHAARPLTLVETTITMLHGLLTADGGFHSRAEDDTVELHPTATGEPSPPSDGTRSYYAGITIEE